MYNICKIKNLTGTIDTLHGHEFAIDEVYTIQEVRRSSWASSDAVVEAVAAGDYEIHDSNGAISGASAQIDWLKDADNRPLNNMAFDDNCGCTFRGTGFTDTVTAGTSKDCDFKIPVNSKFNGLMLFFENEAYGDKADLKIVDVDNVLGYGAGFVVHQFAWDWYFKPGKVCTNILPYADDLLKDLYIRIAYTSTGGTDVEVYCNLFIHKTD